MNVLRTAHYSFAAAGNSSADKPPPPGLDVGIFEVIDRDRAGRFFFRDPGLEWRQIEEDRIDLVPVVDWALARLLTVLRDAGPEREADALVRVDADSLRLTFEVQDARGTIVAELSLVASRSAAAGLWQGAARSFVAGKDVLKELEALLVAEPERLTTFRLAVPWRRPFGWNGAKFLGQTSLTRPDYYRRDQVVAREEARERLIARPDAPRPFSVRERPRSADGPERNASRRAGRYTDVIPPPELWEARPNWSYARHEEGRRDQDETTLKPSAQQRYISDEVDETAGEAWLPDGRVRPALIRVVSGEPRSVVCVDEASTWEFDCGPEATGVPQLTPEQQARFPVRIVSRLSRDPRDPSDTIRLVVDATGRVTPWEFGL